MLKGKEPSPQSARPRALFIEIYPYHGCWFYSHAILLEKLGYDIDVAVHEKWAPEVDSLFPSAPKHTLILKAHKTSIANASLWALARHIRKYKYDLIFINSFRAHKLIFLIVLLPLRTQALAMNHCPSNIKNFRQKIMFPRVKILVSSQRILESIKPLAPNVKFTYFHPVYSPLPIQELDKAGPLTIVIPGSLHPRRRDHLTLIQLIAENPSAFEGVQFHLLGDSLRFDGPKLLALIHQKNIARFFIWHEGYVPEATFLEALRKAHAILPLIHPNTTFVERYRSIQTSGSITNAYQSARPLLLEEGMTQGHNEFTHCALTYTLETLTQLIDNINKDRSPLFRIHAYMKEDPRFNLHTQAQRVMGLMQRKA